MILLVALLLYIFCDGLHAFKLFSFSYRSGSKFRSEHSIRMSDTSKREEDIRTALKIARETSDPLSPEQMNQNDDSWIESFKEKRSYISIITERLVQTIDDYQVSAKVKSDVVGKSAKKERIVVLGTGWGAHAFLKSIDTTIYDVTVVSPRNYFMFTPMLAASAVGTVEFRSIIEPIRNINPSIEYLEAVATNIITKDKMITCESLQCTGTSCDILSFDLGYDYLITSVGATTNTFGIKGVREHCQFLKQIEDASSLRKSIAFCFERACIPSLSDDERRAALSFVIVGAGPTGVEFTGELRDWLEVEGRRYYGSLLKFVQIVLVEAGKAVLPIFDEKLQGEAFVSLTGWLLNLFHFLMLTYSITLD